MPPVTAESIWPELLRQWPQFLGYLISFTTIGIYWSNHHHMFKYIKRADQNLLLINLIFLMCIVFLPFTTGVLTEFIGHPGGNQTRATVLYNASSLVCGVTYNLVWRYGVSGAGLRDETVTPAAYDDLTRSYTLSLIWYLGSVFLALISVPAALGLAFLLGWYYSLPPLLRPDKSVKRRLGRGKGG